MSREKRKIRDKFDLLSAVHKAEYSLLQRPVNKRTGNPIEPAHKFEVNLEGDSCTKEKYENHQPSSFSDLFQVRRVP